MEVTEHGYPVLTFGKYKGTCARCVADHDPGYAQWCLAQEGLTERYPELCGYWAAMGITPLRYCSALNRDGSPCTMHAKHGDLCKRHFNRDSADDFSAWESELISA